MRYGLCWGVLVCDCSRATWQGLKGKGEQGGVWCSWPVGIKCKRQCTTIAVVDYAATAPLALSFKLQLLILLLLPFPKALSLMLPGLGASWLFCSSPACPSPCCCCRPCRPPLSAAT